MTLIAHNKDGGISSAWQIGEVNALGYRFQ